MPTDAEIARFLCERVLGWEPHGDEWLVNGYRHAETPDPLSPYGFVLLLMALVADNREVKLLGGYAGFRALVARASYSDKFDDISNRNPCRALMLATAKAYGMEGV